MAEKLKLSFEDFFGAATVYMISRDYDNNIKLYVSRLIRDRTDIQFYSNGTITGTVLSPHQFTVWSNVEQRPTLVDAFIEGIDNRNESVLDSIKIWNESENIKFNDRILGYVNKETDESCDTGNPKKTIIKVLGPFEFYK